MATVAAILADQQLIDGLGDLSIQDQEQGAMTNHIGFGGHGEVCAICLEKIELEETALIKGCEHAYCVTCILQWATYKEKPTCPQCKHPLEFLNIHRSLDGSLHDNMVEESVCLLLRATWLKPIVVDENAHLHDDLEEYIPSEVGQHEAYEYDYLYGYDEEEDDAYFRSSLSSLSRIGNRRGGDNGYVRAGRQEARPINRRSRSAENEASGSSRTPKQKETAATKEENTGRRAKRALKRGAADKAAAAKHQMHLERLGRI